MNKGQKTLTGPSVHAWINGGWDVRRGYTTVRTVDCALCGAPIPSGTLIVKLLSNQVVGNCCVECHARPLQRGAPGKGPSYVPALAKESCPACRRDVKHFTYKGRVVCPTCGGSGHVDGTGTLDNTVT